MESEEFYVNLPSNTRVTNEAKQQNTTSKFRVALPREIRLDGNWEMALVEMQYPYSWDNLSAKHEIYNQLEIEIRLYRKYSDTDKRQMYSITVGPGHYTNVKDLLTEIGHGTKRMLENVKKDKSIPMAERKEIIIELENLSKIKYNKHYQRVKLTGETKVGSGFLLSKKLAYMLGFKQEFLIPPVKASYPPDLRGGIDSIYVYCDICEPQIIGDTYEHILRILPVSGHYGEIVTNTFVDPHYIGVLRKNFSSIEIAINTDQNQPVPFAFGKCVVKLHFRKKK